MPESALRIAARTLVEVGATASGAAALTRRLHRHNITILAYHNVVRPDDAGRGDGSLHLALPRFIDQIDRLMRTHEIVDLDDVAERTTRSRPRAVITFDDAYRGAVTLALPELRRRALPAVVFVAPAMLGRHSTWWDLMAEAQLLSDAVRDDALARLGGRDSLIRPALPGAANDVILPASYGIATLDELRAHAGNEIRIASHCWAHEYLPALDESELRDTLGRTLEWINALDLPTSRWLALPYGGGNDDVGRVAAELGHAGTLRIEGGQWDGRRGATRVPRVNVPAGLSLRGFDMRTSGLRS